MNATSCKVTVLRQSAVAADIRCLTVQWPVAASKSCTLMGRDRMGVSLAAQARSIKNCPALAGRLASCPAPSACMILTPRPAH